MAEIHSLILKSDSTQISKSSTDLDKLSKSAGKADNSTTKLTKTTNTATTSLMGMKTAVVSIVAALGVTKIIGYADSWSLVNSRLKLATDSTEEFSKAQKELFEISQLTRQEFTATADLYSRMARATKSLGTNQEDLLKVTQTVNEALIVSGASAQEASSVITQLGQGLASGVLRGEEFNSIMENGSRVALALADSLGVNLGELRAMAKEGKLTSEIIVNALVDQADTVHSEFSKMTVTVAQSQTQVSNAFMQTVGTINDVTGATEGLSNMLTGLADTFDDNQVAIANFAMFTYATISRMVDGFNLLQESAELGITGLMSIPEASLHAFKILIAELTLDLKDLANEASEALGGGAIFDDDSITRTLTQLNLATDAQVQFTKSLKEEAKEVTDAFEAWNVTVEERISLIKQEESATSATNELKKETVKISQEELQIEEDLLGFQTSINDLLAEENALREENLESVKEMAKALTKNIDFAGYGNNLEEEKTNELGNQITATGHLIAVTANGAKEGSKGQEMLQKASELAAIAAGAVAILTQGQGDPYTAIARMAAMAISVANILGSSNISGGGGSVANTSVTEASSFRALSEAATPDVKFDDFIKGLESASKALEDFGNIGTSIGGQIEVLQTQISNIMDTVSTQEADLAQARLDFNIPEGGDLFKEGEYDASVLITTFTKDIGVAKELASKYTDELNRIILDTVIEALDYSKLSNEQISGITDSIDIQSYKDMKQELNNIAIETKLAGGVLEDNTRVLEIWSDTNFQAGEDMAELIDILDEAAEKVAQTRTSLEKELLLLKTTDAIENLALRRQYEMNELTDEGNKLLLQQIFDEEDRQSLLEEAIRLQEEAIRVQEEAQRNALTSQINAYREQESALNEYLSNVVSQISMLEGSFKSLKDIVSSLRGQTLGADYTLQEFYASMKETQELSLTSDYEAFSKSVSDTIALSRVLSDVSAFGNIERDMLFAQGVAARQFELLEDNTLDQIDYLKLIEENTREQLNSLANQITILNNQLSAIGTSNELLTEIDTNGDGVMDTRLLYDASGNLVALEKIENATDETAAQVSSLKDDDYLWGIRYQTANTANWTRSTYSYTKLNWEVLKDISASLSTSSEPGTTAALSTMEVSSLSVPSQMTTTSSTSNEQDNMIYELRKSNTYLVRLINKADQQIEGTENTNKILSEESA